MSAIQTAPGELAVKKKRSLPGSGPHVATQQRAANPDDYSLRRRPTPSAAARLLLLHKPWGLLSQFTSEGGHPALDGLGLPADVYAAGRLDRDSEGLLLLTNDGTLQARIASPRHKWPKRYWVQVEGDIDAAAIAALASGVRLRDGPTRPARVERLPAAPLPPRDPPIRERRNIPTSWLAITLREGRNRQVRRMTAHVGYPTLRLFREAVGPLHVGGLEPGQWRELGPGELARLRQWRPGSR